MTNEQIRKVAIANGFKLKEQPSGEVDLNPYVYEFARQLAVKELLSVTANIKHHKPSHFADALWIVSCAINKIENETPREADND